MHKEKLAASPWSDNQFMGKYHEIPLAVENVDAWIAPTFLFSNDDSHVYF